VHILAFSFWWLAGLFVSVFFHGIYGVDSAWINTANCPRRMLMNMSGSVCVCVCEKEREVEAYKDHPERAFFCLKERRGRGKRDKQERRLMKKGCER